MFKKLGLFAVVLIVLALFSGATIAQYQEPFCGTLSESDCAIILKSAEAMQAANSAEFSFDMTFNFETNDFTFRDFPGFSMSMVGSLITDKDAMPEMPETTMGMNTTDQMQLFADMMDAVDMELVFTMALPRQLTNDPSLPESFSLEMRTVDGVGYMNFDGLSALSEDMLQGWHGTDLSVLINTLALMSASMNTSSSIDPQAIEDIDYNNFMTITRLVDTNIDGIDMAVFEMTLDYAAMFNDPAFHDIFMQSFRGGMGPSGGNMSDEELLDMVRNFEGWVLTVKEYVGLNDYYAYQYDFFMEFPMETGFGARRETMVISFDGVIRIGNFNNVAPIAAPDNATIHTLQEILEAIGQGGF